MFTLIKRPRIVEAAFNKIEWGFNYENYAVGDLFYVDILKADGSLLTTLIKNGSGTGRATFDVSHTLRTLFNEVMPYDPTRFMQKDDTAMKGYSIKAGFIKMVNRQQVKKHLYTSCNFYVLRAALPFDGSVTVADLTVNYDVPVQFLTDITPSQPSGNNLYLPVLFTAPNEVKVKINYVTEVQTISASIPSAGVYVFNVKPELQNKAHSNFTVWLEADNKVHTALREVYHICANVGETGGHQATGFGYSTVSFYDAEIKAEDIANPLAAANLVCENNGTGPGTYTATVTETVYCTNGVEGSSMATATRTSNISQTDAEQKARTAAIAMAQEGLVCTPPPTKYTATYTYTAYCPTGYSGQKTVNGYGESYYSQAEADQNAFNSAKTGAESGLVCTLNEQPKIFAGYTTYGHLSFNDANNDTFYPSALYTDDGTLESGKLTYTSPAGNYNLVRGFYKIDIGMVFEVGTDGRILNIYLASPGGQIQ
ncbi:hypothetical protein [uncultured Pontibacter sp.]|uniref:hypothetical protein n=1 Tax=uncultured Pontibacter sp. TaxID=453356 RepID=UPI002606A40A|nr:hypothetical protein [uncultured Pontibacter sp.]